MLSKSRLFLHFSLPLLILSVVVACSDDPEVKDTEGPSIQFVQESQTQFTGSVDLTFKTSDNKSISQIQIFIDGNLVSDQKFSSPNEDFSFNWDSKSVTDGTHQLKITVSDSSGNATEKTYQIIVKNILLSLLVPENYLIGNEELWVFLSDHAGKILGTKQAQNNSTLEFSMVDGFSDETLMIHMFSFTHSDLDKQRTLKSYAYVKPGALHLTLRTSLEVKQNYGNAEINITSVPAGYHHNVSGDISGVGGSFGEYVSDSYHISCERLSNNPAQLLIALYNDDGSAKYKIIEGVTGGSQIDVAFNDFIDMHHDLLSTPGANGSSQLEVGYRTEEGTKKSFMYNLNIYDGSSDAINSYYPEGVFDSYFTIFSIDYGNISYAYFTNDVLPPSTFKKSTAELISHDFSNSGVRLQTSGNSQVITLLSSNYIFSNDQNVGDIRIVNMPFKSSVNFVLPELPDAIKVLYYQDGYTVYPFGSMTMQASAESYNDELGYMFSSNGSSIELPEILNTSVYFNTDQGGRIRTGTTETFENLIFPNYLRFLPLSSKDRLKIQKLFHR